MKKLIQIQRYKAGVTVGIIFVLGWWLGVHSLPVFNWLVSKKNPDVSTLRLSGYKYISPLLLCDTSVKSTPPKLASLEKKLNDYINEKISRHELIAGSIFFRDFSSNTNLAINPAEKFYPASLNKIPTMIAVYKMAELNPGFLDQQVEYTDPDFNQGQMVLPKSSLETGQTYTIREAIDRIIKYSDNNGLHLLANYIKPEIFVDTFNDLKIPMQAANNEVIDLVTVENISYFLRVLYNATYLNRESSEAALGLLTQVDYQNGLNKGVPDFINVAHKFGQVKLKVNKTEMMEMHDCGIVYYPYRPYLLCVMTKGGGEIKSLETVIQDVSKMVYEEVNTKG
jgi:beta-lactamase class A